MYKQIKLTSTRPILFDAELALKAVNGLRKESGYKKDGKNPITLAQFVSTTKVLEDRSPEFGHLFLRLNYNDKNGSPCTRSFPNFSLAIASKCTLLLADQNVEVVISVIAKAGKQKWQLAEIAECVDVLSDERTTFSLSFSSDQTSDPAGNFQTIQLANGTEGRFGFTVLPSYFFTHSFT